MCVCWIWIWFRIHLALNIIYWYIVTSFRVVPSLQSPPSLHSDSRFSAGHHHLQQAFQGRSHPHLVRKRSCSSQSWIHGVRDRWWWWRRRRLLRLQWGYLGPIYIYIYNKKGFLFVRLMKGLGCEMKWNVRLLSLVHLSVLRLWWWSSSGYYHQLKIDRMMLIND